MFGSLFKNRKINKSAHDLFSIVIEQSRLPSIYTDMEVEDSLDGRFDVMSLHMSLLLKKIDQNGEREECKVLKRRLQEIMFDNLDLTIREIGVGDMGVGKKVKVMAEAFYGRMLAYHEALGAEDGSELSKVIKRNIYRERDIDQNILLFMNKYTSEQWKHLENLEIDDILNGKLSFLASI